MSEHLNIIPSHIKQKYFVDAYECMHIDRENKGRYKREGNKTHGADIGEW